MDLDDVVNPREQNQGMAEQQQDGQVEQNDGQEAADGAPAAPQSQNQTHVPLSALEAERKTRQDWKEKAIRYEEEIKQLRAQSQPQASEAQDPVQSLQQQVINERFNTSEMLARQTYKDLDDKVEVFMEAAKQNPALAAALSNQRHPWDFAYKEGARLLMLREVGDDPAAYRAKIEAEIRQQLSAPQKLDVPTTLNGARSVAPRSSGGFTGPTPLEAIVNR